MSPVFIDGISSAVLGCVSPVSSLLKVGTSALYGSCSVLVGGTSDVLASLSMTPLGIREDESLSNLQHPQIQQ